LDFCFQKDENEKAYYCCSSEVRKTKKEWKMSKRHPGREGLRGTQYIRPWLSDLRATVRIADIPQSTTSCPANAIHGHCRPSQEEL
jgi:hypothetical protein